MGLNQTQRALSAAEQAVELNPDSPEAYYARARVTWLTQFDSSTAIDDYMAAYELAPYRVDAAVAAAELESYYGDGERALDILTAARDANPDNPGLLRLMGNIYTRVVGDPNQAADVLSRCVDVNAQFAPCFYEYGRVLIQLEQLGSAEGYGRAAEMLSEAVRLQNEQGDVIPAYNYWAGEAQIYLGNCSAALVYLQEGYDAAVEQENTDAAEDLQGSIQECSGFNAAPAPTTAPTTTGNTASQSTAAPSAVPNA